MTASVMDRTTTGQNVWIIQMATDVDVVQAMYGTLDTVWVSDLVDDTSTQIEHKVTISACFILALILKIKLCIGTSTISEKPF